MERYEMENRIEKLEKELNELKEDIKEQDEGIFEIDSLEGSRGKALKIEIIRDKKIRYSPTIQAQKLYDFIIKEMGGQTQIEFDKIKH